ncbi:MAG TPA: hypothetical protein VM142_04685 [Acidimicrobiales bacterium]|nr:hypothetical protein [Acidimicrobiales bacterium]
MLRRRARERKWASIFAEDLLRGCSDLYTVFGGDVLNLPISIPIDERAVVLLQPRGPLEAPRVPATMTVTRPASGAYGVNIRRIDEGPMIIPGLDDLPLTDLTFLLTVEGLEIGPGELPLDETTARALANALLITIGMKLAKAGHGQGATP